MVKKDTAIIDFGSATITVIVGERGVNRTFRIRGKGSADYAGFQNGEFLEESEVRNAVAFALANCETESGLKISEIYVGVPGEFTSVVCRDTMISFPRKRRIGDAELRELYQSSNIFKKHPTHSVINQCPVYFTLEDGRRVIEPRNMASSKLRGLISFVLAENNFIDFVDRILSQLGVRRLGFISSCLAETMFLFDGAVRDRYVLLIDSGYITTSVMLGRGDALLSLSSFSMGGGHISGDLAQCLKIPFAEAESLKRKLVLSWNPGEEDTYEVQGREFINPYSATAANEIANDRVEMIASYIQKCIDRFDFEFPDYLPLYLTGGGLNYIKGITGVLSKRLGRRVELVAPPLPNAARPDFSSEIGLLDFALSFGESGNYIVRR